jgi:hypothetical protein
MSMSCFVLRPDGIGYKCLADSCRCNEEKLGFRELLYALRHWTGEAHPLLRLYQSVEELAEEFWGGIEDAGPGIAVKPAKPAEPTMSFDELAALIGATTE